MCSCRFNERCSKKISNLLKKGCILTDTGSTKNSVIKDIQPFIKEDVWFIPSHPLAGTENSGPGAGFPELFKGKVLGCCALLFNT